MATQEGSARPALVLDTNIVLDWLLFKDSGVAALAAALEARQLHWLTCTRMRDEFQRTLAYPALAKRKPDSERLLTLFDQHAAVQPDPPPVPPALRCDDPDDQVFIDLALAGRARWLVTHDRAVLRLRRRVAAYGLHILKPANWSLP